MALKRMDNVGIVVSDLDATIAFFRELGLDLEGRATVDSSSLGFSCRPSSQITGTLR
jgi:catechol 2,3-dioxygenase-like lactoylglutathione lyase family enzyme